jgi:hypothetical protein
LPDGLYRELRQLLEYEIAHTPWSMGAVHMARWVAVRQAIGRGNRLVTVDYDNNAFEAAAEALEGTPAAGAAAAVKTSYYWMERLRYEGRFQGSPGMGVGDSRRQRTPPT